MVRGLPRAPSNAGHSSNGSPTVTDDETLACSVIPAVKAIRDGAAVVTGGERPAATVAQRERLERAHSDGNVLSSVVADGSLQNDL